MAVIAVVAVEKYLVATTTTTAKRNFVVVTMILPLVLLILFDAFVFADADAVILFPDVAAAILDTNKILIPLYYFICSLSPITVDFCNQLIINFMIPIPLMLFPDLDLDLYSSYH